MGKIFDDANMDGFIEVKYGLDFLDKQVHIGDEVVMPAKDSFIFGKVIKIYKYEEDDEDDSYYTYFIITDKNREVIKQYYSIIKI